MLRWVWKSFSTLKIKTNIYIHFKEFPKVLIEAISIFSWNGEETEDFKIASACKEHVKDAERLLAHQEMESILFTVN